MKDLTGLSREQLLLEEQKAVDQIHFLDKRTFDPRHRELYQKLNRKISRIEALLRHDEDIE